MYCIHYTTLCIMIDLPLFFLSSIFSHYQDQVVKMSTMLNCMFNSSLLNPLLLNTSTCILYTIYQCLSENEIFLCDFDYFK